MNFSPVMHILHQTLIAGILNVYIFCIKFYGCFELHIALCVLGLKEMSVNLTENALVIFCQDIIHFSSDFFLEKCKKYSPPKYNEKHEYIYYKEKSCQQFTIYIYIYMSYIIWQGSLMKVKAYKKM